MKLIIQKTKIMASGPITSWKVKRETVKAVTAFIFFGYKITVDSDCSQKIKRELLLGMKARTNLDSTLKNKSITFLRKIHVVKAVIFPIVM